MDPITESQLLSTRRQFFHNAGRVGVGAAALATLLNPLDLQAKNSQAKASLAKNNGPGYGPGEPGPTHFPAKAKRVIYLCQAGAPSQVDTFDYKPTLEKLNGKDLPKSIRNNQRVTGMTARQKTFPVAKSSFRFRQHGKSGQWISDLLPHHHKIADDICIINSMYTEAINHDPAITFFQTGHQQPGRPSLGAWLSYGLGSECDNLPSFVVMLDKNSDNQAQPTYSRLWGSAFLPSNHQGVKLRSSGNPVLYLKDPTGMGLKESRGLLDDIAAMNTIRKKQVGDPEIDTRIAAYEMMYRMQMSVPKLTDISKEPKSTLDLYGPEVKVPGTHASNCLRARRLAERGVRFIQIYHRGWDHHNNLPSKHARIAKEVDQGSAALIQDLKQRDMLKDTLVVWGGEFGRTVYRQGGNAKNYGRDHHPRCFSIWMAGGGIKPGMRYGQTDDWCYNIVDRATSGMHVHDLNATILQLMGIDHKRLTYRFQGRDYRITDVHGTVPKKILA